MDGLFKNKSFLNMSVILVVGLCAFPTITVADPIDSLRAFFPSSSDGAYLFLRQLFGDIVCVVAKDSVCSGDPQPSLLVNVLVTMTSLVMFVAGLIGVYIVIVGTMATAHTGEIFGPKWSTVWVPLRAIAGPLFVLPNPLMAGLAPAQVVVILIGLVSIGLANGTWRTAVDFTGSTTIISAPIGTIKGNELQYDLATAILKSEVCTFALYRQLQEAKRNPEISHSFRDHSPGFSADGFIAGTREVTMRSIAWSVEGFDYRLCGRLSFPINIKTNLDEQSAILLTNVIKHHNAVLINQLISDLRKIAKSIVYPEKYRESTATLAEKFRQAVHKFNRNVTDKAISSLQLYKGELISNFKKHAITGGWVYAGSWFWRLAEMQSQVDAVVYDNLDSFSFLKPRENLPPVMADYISSRLARVEALRKFIAANSGLYSEIEQMEKEGDFSILDQLAHKLGESITSVMQSDGAEHPLLAMKSVGNSLIIIAAGVGLISTDNLFISMIALIMVVIGGTLSHYVPLLPFITYLFGVGGWLIYFILAMVAVPVWGVMHMLPEGDGIAGQATHGYYHLLTLLLRPLLLVLGLVSGFVLFYVLIHFFNGIFFGFMALSGLNHFIHSVTMIVIYTFIVVGLARMSFSLIYRIPAGVPQWFGFGSSDLVAPHSEEPAHELKNTFGLFGHFGSKKTAPKQLPNPSEGGGGDGGGEGADSEPSSGGSSGPGGSPGSDRLTQDLIPEGHSHIPSDGSAMGNDPQQQELSLGFSSEDSNDTEDSVDEDNGRLVDDTLDTKPGGRKDSGASSQSEGSEDHSHSTPDQEDEPSEEELEEILTHLDNNLSYEDLQSAANGDRQDTQTDELIPNVPNPGKGQ